MANSLSQFIAQIRQQRELDLNQKMASVIPLIEQDIKNGMQKQEEQDTLNKRGSDYYEIAKQQYGEEKANEWKAGTVGFQTPEAYDLSFKNFNARQGDTEETVNYRNAALNALEAMDLDKANLEEARAKIGAAQTKDEVELLYKAYGTKILKPSSGRGGGGSGSGGGTGGGKVKVDSNYKAQVNRVVHNGYVYWVQNNGRKVMSKIKRTTDGRLQLPNGMIADPYQLIARTSFTTKDGDAGDISEYRDITNDFQQGGAEAAPQQAVKGKQATVQAAEGLEGIPGVKVIKKGRK